MDFADGGEDDKDRDGMENAGDEESGTVAVLIDEVADEQAEEHSAEGAGAAQKTFDRADDFGGKEVGGEGLDVRGPELVSEHGHAEKDNGVAQG